MLWTNFSKFVTNLKTNFSGEKLCQKSALIDWTLLLLLLLLLLTGTEYRPKKVNLYIIKEYGMQFLCLKTLIFSIKFNCLCLCWILPSKEGWWQSFCTFYALSWI